jgi:hypothetical protein
MEGTPRKRPQLVRVSTLIAPILPAIKVRFHTAFPVRSTENIRSNWQSRVRVFVLENAARPGLGLQTTGYWGTRNRVQWEAIHRDCRDNSCLAGRLCSLAFSMTGKGGIFLPEAEVGTRQSDLRTPRGFHSLFVLCLRVREVDDKRGISDDGGRCKSFFCCWSVNSAAARLQNTWSA